MYPGANTTASGRLCLFLAALGAAEGLQCYVCLPRADSAGAAEVTDIFPGLPRSQLCDDFRPGEDHRNYIKECPPSYKGCLEQINGSAVTRSCSELDNVNDCQTVNAIRYCFCSAPLCNNRDLRDAASAVAVRPPTDDEDQDGGGGLEGSGGGPLHPIVTPATTPGTRTNSTREPSTAGGGAVYQRTFLLPFVVGVGVFLVR